MALAKFRHKYPQGSLVSELIEIDRGTYIVKALVQIDNIILATALAGATTVEAAEDAAKERAIASLFLDHQPNISPPIALQADTAPVKAQPSTSLSRKPDASEQTSNHKIVNFSKPQAEAATQTQDSTPDITPVNLPVTPPPEVELDLPPEVPLVNSDPSAETNTETNLFGDTFTAETPPAISTPEDKVDPATNLISPELEAMDFNEIKQKTDIEIKRLSWTKDQGKEFLMSRYGKRSRLHLTDEQLLEFLRYLEKLPNPIK